MLFVVIILLALFAIWLDWLWWKSIRGKVSCVGKYLFVGITVGSHALLPAVAVVSVVLSDNTPWFVQFAMWCYWTWLFLVMPRVIFYLLQMIHHPWWGVVGGVAIGVLLVWGATYGRTSILVTHQTISSQKIPQAFDGFKIVQISDIHLGTMVNRDEELKAIVDSVNSLKADMVIFTGDMVHIRSVELDAKAQAILSMVKAPYGVYSITGNHDVGVYVKDTLSLPLEVCQKEVIERQEEMGWQMLQDTTVLITKDDAQISLSGIAFDTSLRKKRHDKDLPPANLDKVYGNTPDSLFNITAVHLPQIWEQLLPTPYGNLTLSGHVHAMQMKLRIGSVAISPARLLYRRWSGLYTEKDHNLYINDGTGCVVYPMRLGAWPEITLITLSSCE